MKISRELKIGFVLIAAIFLLYFGMNFLKGLNIFSPMRTYFGQFDQLNQIETSSPVYIRGYKVGQVSEIEYDFSKPQAFTISIVISKNIHLPQGTQMAIIPDGLLGGSAIELRLGSDKSQFFAANDTLPTLIEGGIMDELKNGLLADLSKTINDIDTVVVNLKGQLEGNQVKEILDNVDNISKDLNVSSIKLKHIINNDVPPIVNDAKTTLADARQAMGKINDISQKIDTIDFQGIATKIDTTLTNIQQISETVNSTDGTVGLLLNDKALYNKVSRTIESADTLINDIKANPKKYLKISVF